MINKIVLPERNINVEYQSDVLVVGAGLAGVAAAISAARTGVSVILAEKNNYPGGVATSSLMCSSTNHFYLADDTQVVKGIAEELIFELINIQGSNKNLTHIQPQIPHEPEAFKRMMISKLREAGVTTLYGSRFIEPVMNGDNIDSCLFFSRDKIFAVKAKQVVDCTGDLSVLKTAGCDYIQGDYDWCSLLLRMRDVNIDKFIDWLEASPEDYNPEIDIPTSLEETVRLWRESGVFHLPHGGGKSIRFIKEAIFRGDIPIFVGKYIYSLWILGMFSDRANKGTVVINSNGIRVHGFNTEKFSMIAEEARFACKVVSDYLIKAMPGFEKAKLLQTADQIGRRQSRLFKGIKPIESINFQEDTECPDVVGLMSEVTSINGIRQRCHIPGKLPLSAIQTNLPKNGLSGSGKNLRGMRGQVGCMVNGQAAAVAAAAAVKQSVSAYEVDYDEVRKILLEQNVVLDISVKEEI